MEITGECTLNLWRLFILIGIGCMIKLSFQVFSLLQEVITSLLYPLLRRDLRKYGEWAIVTGASDGIGKAYSLELAKRGLKVILMSRTQAKLDAVAKEIKSKFNVDTKVIVADFTRNKDLYEELAHHIEGLDIGILVNNVGMSFEYPNHFGEMSPDTIWNVMTCNTAAMTMMSRLVLPQMLEKKKGIIVNFSSTVALFPAPLYSLYASTKTYIDTFSRALQYEYSNKGIIVQSLLPGVVVTQMAKHVTEKVTWLTPSPTTYASSAVRTIGTLQRTCGYIGHSLQAWFISLLPEWIVMYGVYKSGLKFMNQASKKWI